MAGWGVLLTVLVSLAATVAGTVAFFGRARRGRLAFAGRPFQVVERVGVVAVVVGSAALLAVSPVVGVLWASVLLNYLFGKGENVPFSRFPMFERPAKRVFFVHIQDDQGRPVDLRPFGVYPSDLKKRFEFELGTPTAMADDESRRRAAKVIAQWVEELRPRRGPHATVPIRVVLVEHRLAGSRVVSTSDVLLEAGAA